MPRNLNIPGLIVIFHDGEVGALLRDPQGDTGKDVQRRAYAVQKRMKRLAKVRTGELRNGIHVESVHYRPDGPAARITSNAPHTLVNEVGRGPVRVGTRGGGGPYGGSGGGLTLASGGIRGGRVASRSGSSLSRGSGRAIALSISTSGGTIFRMSAGPAAGSHFMERSIDAALE